MPNTDYEFTIARPSRREVIYHTCGRHRADMNHIDMNLYEYEARSSTLELRVYDPFGEFQPGESFRVTSADQYGLRESFSRITQASFSFRPSFNPHLVDRVPIGRDSVGVEPEHRPLRLSRNHIH